MSILLDEAGIRRALERMADEITVGIPPESPVAIVGIRRRGDELARRIIELLQARGYEMPAYGSLDITLYRDDLAEIGPAAQVRTTEIDFDVAGTYLVLVDDVIHTGRSIRAALDAIMDLGRPRTIKLAVLVDRGGRELPIQPDFVGVCAPNAEAHVRVCLRSEATPERVEAEP